MLNNYAKAVSSRHFAGAFVTAIRCLGRDFAADP